MANSYTDANGIFHNKLGITAAEQLKRTEYDLTAQRSREVLEQNALGSVRGFGLERQQAIHKHLFQDVYEWAGQIRTVPSRKRITKFLPDRHSPGCAAKAAPQVA